MGTRQAFQSDRTLLTDDDDFDDDYDDPQLREALGLKNAARQEGFPHADHDEDDVMISGVGVLPRAAEVCSSHPFS